MRQTVSNFSEKVLIIIVSIVAVSFFIEVAWAPIGPVMTEITIYRLRKILPEQKARWLAHGIQDYSIEVNGYTAWDTCDAKLIVRGGKLADVEVHVPPLDPTEMSKIPIPTEEWVDVWDNYPQCEYEEFTVLAFLESATELLAAANPMEDFYNVKFDHYWGYITSYKYEAHFGYGLWAMSIADGCETYEFSNFQPLPP